MFLSPVGLEKLRPGPPIRERPWLSLGRGPACSRGSCHLASHLSHCQPGGRKVVLITPLYRGARLAEGRGSLLCHTNLEKGGKELSCHPPLKYPPPGVCPLLSRTAFLQGNQEEDMGKPNFAEVRGAPATQHQVSQGRQRVSLEGFTPPGEEAGTTAPSQDTQALGHIWAGRALGSQRACTQPVLLAGKSTQHSRVQSTDHQ